jgi:hypothetical protein
MSFIRKLFGLRDKGSDIPRSSIKYATKGRTMPNSSTDFDRKMARLEKLAQAKAGKLSCEKCGRVSERMDVCPHCLGVFCHDCMSPEKNMRLHPEHHIEVICCPLCEGFLL